MGPAALTQPQKHRLGLAGPVLTRLHPCCPSQIHAKVNGHHAPPPQAPAQPDAAAQQAPSGALAAAYSSMENGGSCDEPSSAQGEEGQQEKSPVLQFCASLGLEYCGKVCAAMEQSRQSSPLLPPLLSLHHRLPPTSS